ncbi:MAG: hypothetical protein AMXMBFR66_09710 [Pseudomonadota bacterium]|nr:SPOR domain-containing protein [Rubrivivax sp.]
MKPRRGAFVVGLVIGLLLGLAIALGVALYITKAPVPFLNKVPGRTAEQDNAEAERNKNWDPNAPLGSKLPARPQAAASEAGTAASAAAGGIAGNVAGAGVSPPPAAARTTPDAAAIVPGAAAPAAPRSAAPGVDPFTYFVQAGAFTRSDDAEQQKAQLALLGLNAKVSEREQAGRTVHRVRVGPFPTRDEADALQLKLQEAGVEAQIVRVERQ